MTATGAQGFADAQEQLQAASEQVAAGNTDPAVILSISQSENNAAISASIIKADQQNFGRLLDMLA